MPVIQLLAVAITVADLDAEVAFFRDALGLEAGPVHALGEPVCTGLLGLPGGTRAQAVDVAVGSQTIELVAFDPPGAPYTAVRASNDQWFQHVALVSGDIALVHARLRSGGASAITAGGPVLLPPNTGSVTAFKFRDPEGHPLELIAFPDGVGAPVWHRSPGPGILGYDHTAIAVTDLEQSLAFYAGLLGFHLSGRTLNRGPEQDRLDGLAGCDVDVVALAPAAVPVPHVELLHYRTPPGRTAPAVAPNDVASARQIHQVDDLDALIAGLRTAAVPFLSKGAVELDGGRRAAAVWDPDGHVVVLIE